MKADRLSKIVACILFIALAFALLYAHNSPATDYETSIYAATPEVWAILIVGVVGGMALIVYQVYKKGHEESNFWVIGALLILLSSLSIFSLYFIRGYPFYGQYKDTLTHFGYTKYIFQNGVFRYGELYPATHTLVAVISKVSGVDLTMVFNITPLFFYSLYGLFTYSMARVFLSQKGQAIIAVLVGLTFQQIYLIVEFRPYALALAYFPVAFFLIGKLMGTRKRFGWQFVLLLLIIVFLMPILHPLAAGILFIALVALPLASKILAKRPRFSAVPQIGYGLGWSGPMVLAMWLITWVSSFYWWELLINNIYTIATEGPAGQVNVLREQILFAQGFGYSATLEFLKLYGGAVVLLILAAIAFFIIRHRAAGEEKLSLLLLWYGPLAFMFLLMAADLFGGLILGAERFVYMALVVSTLPVGYLLYELTARFRSAENRLVGGAGVILVVALLGGLSIHGILKQYDSPYSLGVNSQVTHMQMAGMSWLWEHKDKDTGMLSWMMVPARWIDLQLTMEDREQRWDIELLYENWYDYARPPYHFGYQQGGMLGEHYDTEMYLVLEKRDRVQYTEVFSEKVAELRFTQADYDRLELDPSVDKIYTNGEMVIRLVVHPV